MSDLSPVTKRLKQDKENIPDVQQKILDSKPEKKEADLQPESEKIGKNDKEEENNLVDDDLESLSESEESDICGFKSGMCAYESDASGSIGGDDGSEEDSGDDDLDSEDENNTVIAFDIGGNHKYQCENGGRFQKYYVADDGTEFYGSNTTIGKSI